MVPKGTPQEVIDKLAATVPEMFKNSRVAGKMKAGGSPMHIMTRDEVKEMWVARQQTLQELLAGTLTGLSMRMRARAGRARLPHGPTGIRQMKRSRRSFDC